MALAHYDARRRERDPLEIQSLSPAEQPPIEVDGDWTRPLDFSQMVVRANNDGSPESNNPLRHESARLTDVPEALPSTVSLSDSESGRLPSTSPTTATLVDYPIGAVETGNTDSAIPPLADMPAQRTSGSAELPTAPNPLPGTGDVAAMGLPELPETSGLPQQGGLPQPEQKAEAPTTSLSQPESMVPTSPKINADFAAYEQEISSGDAEAATLASGQEPPAWVNGGSLSDGTAGLPVPNMDDSASAGVPTPTLPRIETPNTTSQPRIDSNVSDMSDTQRGVMQPTRVFGQQNNSQPSLATPASPPPAGLTTLQSQPQDALPSTPALDIPSLPTNNPSGGVTNQQPNTPPAKMGTAPTGLNPSMSSPQPRAMARVASSAQLVSNTPGNRHLDGSQNPVLLFQKRAPEEIQVGKPATFEIAVRNAGNTTAQGVTVVDQVPRGTRFVESMPPTTPGPDGMLEWKIGEMAAGTTTTISMKLIPEVEGEVGSVATVHFAAQASVRTRATQPKLELNLETQPQVLIGDFQKITVTIRNGGSGMARDVRLEADIPQVLKHDSGDAMLEATIGDMRPGEVKRIELPATGAQPGKANCTVRAVSADGVMNEKSVPVFVQAPKLVAAIEGPKLRYLERQATYRIGVKNVGTADATDLVFEARLPSGLHFNDANNSGSYDPNTHTVSWRLVELPPETPAVVELTVLPVELGPQIISFAAKGALGALAETKQQVTVDGLAELAFTIGQDNGTIEVGASSTYSVQVTNVGNKPDKNVQLIVDLPPGTELLAVDAPVEYRSATNQIVFAPVAEMRNKDQYTYRFQLRHNQPGTQVVRTKLTSENWPKAVVKEEGTLVYNDQN